MPALPSTVVGRIFSPCSFEGVSHKVRAGLLDRVRCEASCAAVYAGRGPAHSGSREVSAWLPHLLRLPDFPQGASFGCKQRAQGPRIPVFIWVSFCRAVHQNDEPSNTLHTRRATERRKRRARPLISPILVRKCRNISPWAAGPWFSPCFSVFQPAWVEL